MWTKVHNGMKASWPNPQLIQENIRSIDHGPQKGQQGAKKGNYPRQNLDLLWYSTMEMIIQEHHSTEENPHPSKTSIGGSFFLYYILKRYVKKNIKNTYNRKKYKKHPLFNSLKGSLELPNSQPISISFPSLQTITTLNFVFILFLFVFQAYLIFLHL